MAKRTKKVGPAGRLGARYGVRIRKRIGDIDRISKVWHECPRCKASAVKRKANGIWECRHCGIQLASSSYVLTPPVAVKREVSEAIAAAKAKEEGVEEAPEEHETAEEELKEQ
jgi:large subunit ribosomal protein L37Ae